MRTITRPIIALSVVLAAVFLNAWPVAAATQPRLGSAANFAVLAGSTITNTGPTVINGGLGVSPGSAVTGFPPGVATSQNKADAVAVQAQTDLVTAYNDLASSGSTSSMTGLDLGGKTLTPGVYSFSSSAQLTGTLTLSGNGIYIFQMGSTLTTASDSQVLVTGGAQACGVYWKVGSSATLGSGTRLVGTVIAQTSITMVTGASIIPGRALARDGAVTLDSNTITSPGGGCTATATASASPAPSSSVAASTAPRSTTTAPRLAQTGGGLPLVATWFALLLVAGVFSIAGGLELVIRRQRL